MTRIPFVKYTSFGNTFVIIDEIERQHLSERQKSAFAYQATNVDFGVGCDNMLVIQKYRPQVLESINAHRKYFATLPLFDDTPYIFRMFEPNGQEAYSCGNGLMSIASYLQKRYGISKARILTELPTASPQKVTIGADAGSAASWAAMGVPGSIPADMAHPKAYLKSHDGLDRIRPLEVRFRANDLISVTRKDKMTLWGYLVYTGEPHLVIFPKNGFSIPELSGAPFMAPASGAVDDYPLEKRYNFGTQLIKLVGNYLNTHYRQVFPRGINVNFAQISQNGSEVLEHRCFERGINRETLACGTGALAVSYVARKLGMIHGTNVAVWPSRCRWHQHDAEFQVVEDNAGWRLVGRPRELFGGSYAFDTAGVQRSSASPDRTARKTALLADHVHPKSSAASLG